MQALENLKPVLETKARRVGGSNYQVPIEVSPERRQTLAIRWLVTYARKRNERTMKEKLAAEIMDAYNNAGGAYKKKMMCIEWLKVIKHLLIIVGRIKENINYA